jgi:molybdenum-dependent DNA-binding transcriptional regulator ModE
MEARAAAGLTPFGQRVVQQYRSIETKAHIAVADDLDALAAAMAKFAARSLIIG